MLYSFSLGLMLYIGEIITMLDTDTASRETIRRLETELGVYKRAYADLDADRRRVERLRLDTNKQKEDLENQLKVTFQTGPPQL